MQYGRVAGKIFNTGGEQRNFATREGSRKKFAPREGSRENLQHRRGAEKFATQEGSREICITGGEQGKVATVASLELLG